MRNTTIQYVESDAMKIGTESIPNYRLLDLVDEVKTIYGKFATREIDHHTVAQLLGHSSASSGSYRQKIADMRSFGLIEPRGEIRVTQTGRKITYPENQSEEQEGLREAIKAIPLWRKIFEKYTEKRLFLPSDFWTDIREWTGLPPEEAREQVDNVKNAYLEDIKYIKQETEEVETVGSEVTGKIDISDTIPEGVLGRVFVEGAGYIDVKDKSTYEIAKAYLRLFADKLGIKEE